MLNKIFCKKQKKSKVVKNIPKQDSKILNEGKLVVKQKKEKTVDLGDVNKLIKFNIKSQYNMIQRKKEIQKIPVMFEIKSEEVEMDESRPGIDIVIAIDISGSMQGQKIKLVRETLLFLVDELKDIDRLSLVTFNSCAQLIAGLQPMTEQNKKIYKELISGIHAGGSTNLKDAIVSSMDVLEKRKESNEVSSILFLSDGDDTCGNNLDKILKAMTTKNKLLLKKKMEYQIHSFGYGQDHDEKVLSEICKFQNGKFYYIENNDIVDECFLDCMGTLMTVIGTKAKINVFAGDKIKIIQKHGQSWDKNNNQKSAFIDVKTISSDQHKTYICEVEIAPLDEDLNELKIVMGVLQYSTENGDKSKENQLILKIVNDDKLGEVNQDVKEEYQQVKAKFVIDEYEQYQNRGDYKKAEEVRNLFVQDLEEDDDFDEDFKVKMKTVLDKEKIKDKKYKMASKQMFMEKAFDPSMAVNFRAQNSKARKMISKKKG